MDAYRKSEKDRAQWLKAWSCLPIKVTRKTGDLRSKEIYVKNPMVSILGGVQTPKIIQKTQEMAPDGLVARIIHVFPKTWKPMEIRDLTVDDSEIMNILSFLENLHRRTDKVIVKMSNEARDYFINYWFPKNQSDQTDIKRKELAASYAKIPDQILRISLILHMIKIAEKREDDMAQLSITTIKEACSFDLYMKDHIIRTFNIIEDKGNEISMIMRVMERFTNAAKKHDGNYTTSLSAISKWCSRIKREDGKETHPIAQEVLEIIRPAIESGHLKKDGSKITIVKALKN
jgi:hypothetical protein